MLNLILLDIINPGKVYSHRGGTIHNKWHKHNKHAYYIIHWKRKVRLLCEGVNKMRGHLEMTLWYWIRSQGGAPRRSKTWRRWRSWSVGYPREEQPRRREWVASRPTCRATWKQSTMWTVRTKGGRDAAWEQGVLRILFIMKWTSYMKHSAEGLAQNHRVPASLPQSHLLPLPHCKPYPAFITGSSLESPQIRMLF